MIKIRLDTAAGVGDRKSRDVFFQYIVNDKYLF